MSFVSRLFSSSSSTSIAEVSLEQAHNNPSNSNGSVPKMNRASQPNGSILRQPSPPGARQQQRRVSFSSDPVRVTTIPANPTRPSTMSHHNDHIIRALPPPAQNHQSFQPQPTTVNNNSWFRSFFGSSKLPISKSSSPSMVKNDQLPANSPIPSQHETFRPLNNSQLLENIPLDLTKSFNGNQLRLAWCKQKDDEPETALDAVENIDLISSQMEPENLNNLDSSPYNLVQASPFKLDPKKVGLLMFNRDGVCGFNNTKSTPLELTLKRLLVENIMEEVPTPKTTNPLLRARASPRKLSTKNSLPPEIPSTVISSLTAESRSQTNKAQIEGVDLNKLNIDVFYPTISEMIFGATSIAQKPVKSMIDTEFANGAKLFAFKLHHLGTQWHNNDNENDTKETDDLFISSFIIDIENVNPRINGFPIQCGVAILWLVPHSSPAFSDGTFKIPPESSPIAKELTLYKLLFNTPGYLMHALQTFAHDLFTLGVANICTCLSWMLYRIADFANGLRLSAELDKNETIDLLVNLIQRYDDKDHCFFISSLLSTIFSFSYKQDRFKVAFWSSKSEKLPMMCQLATLISQFMVKSVHQVSDEMIISDNYRFVIPESLSTDFEMESTELAADANFDGELFQPVPGSSCSSTLSTVTAIHVQANSNISYDHHPHSSIISESQPSGLYNHTTNNHNSYINNSKSDRKSRDESIGYESLTESAVSGNVSPANSEETYDEDEDISNEKVHQSLLDLQNEKYSNEQQKELQEDRALLNVSQTTDYNEDESAIARSDTDNTETSGDENSRAVEEFEEHKYSSSYNSSFSLTKSRQSSYFRGYVDLRYKDAQQKERENGGGKKVQELSSAGDQSEQQQQTSPVISVSGTFPNTHLCKIDGPSDDNLKPVTKLPLSNSSFQSSQTLPPVSPSSSEASQLTHLSQTVESHSLATSPNALQVVQINPTPFNTIELKNETAKKSTTFFKPSLPPSPFGNLSPAASTFYHYSWLSLPVITTQHHDLITTQIILGETFEQATERERNIERDGYPETYEYLYSRLAIKLKEEESNDTVFLVNCDTWSMHLLERALNTSQPFGPVLSNYMTNACERIVSLATIENRKYDVWQYLRYTLTQLMLKSEVLESVLTHDLHLLMKNKCVKKTSRGDEKNQQDMLDIYINEETKAYAKRLWAELIGDQTVGVYLTSDGPKAAFDLFRFRVPTSALYLFSESNLSLFYLPSTVTSRLLDFDSSDLPLIVGMRKLFLRSREPLISSLHGRENAKTFNYLLKMPNFTKRNSSFQYSSQMRPCPVYKTIAFNMLIAGEMPAQSQYKPELKTTSLTEKKNSTKLKERKNNAITVR